MEGVIMYSGTGCPACVQGAAYMRRNAIPFTEVKVDNNLPLIRWLAAQSGQRTIPQFFLGSLHTPSRTLASGRYLNGGLNDVISLVQSGAIQTQR